MGHSLKCPFCLGGIGANDAVFPVKIVTDKGEETTVPCCSVVCAEQTRQRNHDMHQRTANIVANQAIRGIPRKEYLTNSLKSRLPAR